MRAYSEFVGNCTVYGSVTGYASLEHPVKCFHVLPVSVKFFYTRSTSTDCVWLSDGAEVTGNPLDTTGEAVEDELVTFFLSPFELMKTSLAPLVYKLAPQQIGSKCVTG